MRGRGERNAAPQRFFLLRCDVAWIEPRDFEHSRSRSAGSSSGVSTACTGAGTAHMCAHRHAHAAQHVRASSLFVEANARRQRCPGNNTALRGAALSAPSSR